MWGMSRSSRSLGGLVTGALGTTLLILVCAIAFFTVIVPLLLGAQSYTVLTGSMRPALEPGHLIAVRATPIDEIKPGDIITFQIESGNPEVATHRVVGVGYNSEGERLLTTKGDANNVEDANQVQEVQLRGVLVYAVPWLGYLNVWATPAIKSIVITVLGIAAIGWGLVVLLKDTQRRRRVAKASAAVVAAVALIALSPGTATIANATTPDPLLLSADGITWTAGPHLQILDVSHRVVPGDAMPIDLWIRNASTDPAEFAVTGTWSPADPADAGDAALSAALTPPHLDRQAIAPGDSIRTPLAIGLPTASDASTRTSTAILTITVTLTQTGTAPDVPLATTGSNTPVALIVAASVLVAAGFVLLIVRVITTKRRNRRDQ